MAPTPGTEPTTPTTPTAILPPSDEFTDLEREKLQEFRKVVSDLLLKDEQKSDLYLIRWLRARNLDILKAEEMFRTSMKWRKDNNVDTILERIDVPEEAKKEFPIAYLGITKEGYAAFLAPFGRHDIRKALDLYGLETCQNFNIINMEKVDKVMREEGKKIGRDINQIIEIMDCDGYTYRQISNKMCREFMVNMQTCMDNNYPEFLRYAIIVNTPKIFPILFNIMKPFIPKQTLEKIDIYGTDREKWLPIVRERFPMDRVPPYWGGTLEGVDEFCSGHEIWMQGPKDMRAFMNGLTEDDAHFTKFVVQPRDRLVKDVRVTKPGTILEWKFKTEGHDVAFQILYTPRQTLTRNNNNNQGNKKQLKEVVIVPYKRVDAHTAVQEGSHTCEIEGIYSFIFDNSFSIMKSKMLLYQISVALPEEQEQEKVQQEE